jgi:hypothetical protein
MLRFWKTSISPTSIGSWQAACCSMAGRHRSSGGGVDAAGGAAVARGAAAAAVATRAGPNATGYWTIEQETHLELEVKKSKFITTAWPVSSGEQVRFLAGLLLNQQLLVQAHCMPSPSLSSQFLSLTPDSQPTHPGREADPGRRRPLRVPQLLGVEGRGGVPLLGRRGARRDGG